MNRYYHTPVLVQETVEWLVTTPHGRYVDATTGTGGHTKAILDRLAEDAVLLGIDADSQALTAAERRLAKYPQRILLVEANFSHLDAIVKGQSLERIDGLLMDLGLSTLQLETPERGFSFQTEGPLDMRFSLDEQETAAKFINTASEEEIAEVIREYGEERHAARIARSIIQRRPMQTTSDLRAAVEASTPDEHQIKSLARVFQAIRIRVNRELEVLQRTLESVVPLLAIGGRVVVISYHSLEDRIVKNFFQQAEQECVCPPELPVCRCDKVQTLRRLTRGIVEPSAEEVEQNPRARSAKMRVAERV